MSITYRVHYPLISGDSHRDFTDKAKAEAFYQERLNICSGGSRYLSIHAWRRVGMEEIYTDPEAALADLMG